MSSFAVSMGSNSSNPFTGTGNPLGLPSALLSGDTQGYVDNGFYGSGLVPFISAGGFSTDDFPRVSGAVVVVCCYLGGFPTGKFVLALANGALAQSAFSSVAFIDNVGATETFTSSAATFTQVTGYSIWSWPSVRNYPFTGLFSDITFTLGEAAPDEATSPVELYKFSYQTNFLFYTSGAKPVTWMGDTYLPYPIRRGNITNQSASIDQTLDITAFRDFPPAQLFRVQAPSAILNLTVFRKLTPDSGSVFGAIWVGKVLNSAWVANSEVKLQCESDLSSMRRLSLRRRYQLGCSYVLYGRGCNLLASAFQLSASVFTVTGRSVSIPSMAGYRDNYFAGGYLSYVSPLSGITETFAIRSSTAGVLQLPLTPYGLSTATAVAVFPGCNHTTSVCADTFNNLDNFGGQPRIPNTNPFGGAQLF